MLITIAYRCLAARRMQAASMADRGERNTTLASMAKMFAADHANKVAADAVQVGRPRGRGGSSPKSGSSGVAVCVDRPHHHLSRDSQLA